MKVIRSEIETNIYPKDSTANALVIYEVGNSYIEKDNYNLKTEIKRKLKILNRNGFKQANIVIPLYKKDNNAEKISDITATTYNIENGKVTQVKLEKSAIFEENYDENHTLAKFTFPNIKEGSVITYSYTLESPYIYKYKDWEFQSDIPKLYSEYNTSIPANYEYNIKLVGTLKLIRNEQKLVKDCLSNFNGAYADCTNTVYAMKDIPAFVDEEYMTTKSNYLSRIEYELKVFRSFDGRVDNITKSWKDADKELRTNQNIGRQLIKNTSLDGLLATVITNKTNKLSTAKEIYKFVQDNYTWNGDYRVLSDVSVKNLIKEKSGNNTEINILLHNLLDEQGIDVKPVLISTRANGLPTKLYPIISEFNYLIVQATIDGQTYLLDATNKFLSFGTLPFKCLNQYGRLLDFKNGSQWIDIEANNHSSKQYRVDLKLSDNATITGSSENKYTGYNALPKKEKYFANPSDYIEKTADVQSNITILDHKVHTTEKDDQQFEETYQIELDNSSANATQIYLNPFIYKFFSENPFKLQERTYPIDFGFKDAYLYSFKLDLGDAYEVVESPKDINGKLPNDTGDIILQTKVINNQIMIFFKVSFKEVIYNSGYYDVLKTYIRKIIDVQSNSLIVLKKKS